MGDTSLWNSLINFKMILLGIVIESLPFVLLSVLVSAILHNFVSEDTIRRFIPKNKFLSIVPACFLGILFPVCDCGMVPIVRRFVIKGVPLHTAVAFMLAAPIINPVVAAATANAFAPGLMIMGLRLVGAFIVACLAGLIVSFLFEDHQLREGHNNHSNHGCNCGCSCAATVEEAVGGAIPFSARVKKTIYDACGEFFDMGKYLILGAAIGALAQTTLPRALLLSIGQDNALSVAAMMVFAFVVSVCSTADAFIAASFGGSFLHGSLVAFMIFGPMIDIKNVFMLLHGFKSRFVLGLIAIVAFLCGMIGILVNNIL